MAKLKKITNTENIFWDPKRTLTHNKLINVIVGNRGGGKSFGFKELAIDNFINKREQFGYIRRYKDDLKIPLKNFFKDIEYKYPDYEFKTDASKLYIRLKPENENTSWTEDDVAGYGFILSTANNKKSVPYPRVTLLGFDEFLIDKGFQKYIPNEPIALLNLYETIARPGTDHPRVILFMLSNAITITNPYFMFWDLKMPTRQDKNGKWIWKHPTRPILVEDVRNEKFIDKKKNSEFGKLINGTKYAEYSIENKFILDDDVFIEKKSANARYWCTFIYKNNKLGIWIDSAEGKMYVSKNVDPSFPLIYSITLKDHSPNTLFLREKSKAIRFKTFIENYKIGNVRFENINIKNITYEVIQLCMCKF